MSEKVPVTVKQAAAILHWDAPTVYRQVMLGFLESRKERGKLWILLPADMVPNTPNNQRKPA